MVMFLVIFFHPFEQHFTQAVDEVGTLVRLSPAYPCVVARSVLHIQSQQSAHVFHHTLQRDITAVEQFQFVAGVQQLYQIYHFRCPDDRRGSGRYGGNIRTRRMYLIGELAVGLHPFQIGQSADDIGVADQMFLLCRAVMLAQDDQPATQVLQLEKDNGDVVLRTL